MADKTVKVDVVIFKDPVFQKFMAENTVQQADVEGRADRKTLTMAEGPAFRTFCQKFGYYLR